MTAAQQPIAGTMAVTRSLGPGILRVAGWPIESLASLRAPELTERIDRWIAQEEEIRTASRLLAAQLHPLIPTITDRRTRGAALSLKRALTGSPGPLPERMSGPVLQEPALRAIGSALIANATDRVRHAAERAEIERAHASEMERAGAALDCVVGEERFQRALCVASRSLFRQYERAQRVVPSRRSRQRLQSVLHRYLMRAIGRATPNGLWAGVALETMDERAQAPLEVGAAAAVVKVSPVLSIFLRGLESLNRGRPWMDQVTWRINPTLRRIDDGQWEFGTFASGGWALGRIAHHGPLDVLLKAFDRNDRPHLRAIEQALCTGIAGVDPSLAQKICENWIDAGILWSGASLPPFFADTWQALDTLIDVLPAEEQPSWRASRSALRTIAVEIETSIETIRPAELRTQLDAAHQIVAALLARYGAVLSPDDDVLAIDRTAPFRFSLSGAVIERLSRELRSYWVFDRYGLGEIETRIAICGFFDARDGDCIPLAALMSRGGETDPAQRARSWQDRVLPHATDTLAAAACAAFDRWERELEPASARSIHRLTTDHPGRDAVALPPGSALLLIGLSGSAEEAPLRIGGITPEPCFFHSRFAHLFDETDPFRSWHGAGIIRATSEWPRIGFRDLAVRNHLNPNVTARPPSALRLIDPLGADGVLLSTGEIRFNHRGRPVLTTPGDEVVLLPSARSAAYLGGLDRMASVLASLSLFLGRPPLMAPIPRLNREIESWHHLPRLLHGDAIISPERWTPREGFGTVLAQARGAERLIVWRRFVKANALPEFVYAFHGQHQTESLVASDSALAVELLGQELQAHGPALRLQELWPQPESFVVRDRDGRRYMAELAVPWHADDAFWQDYCSGRSEPSPR